MTPSTTNTAARELLASALDECSRPTDAAEVREGRNPFVRGEYALAAIEKAITQQQGGEQEVGDGLPELPEPECRGAGWRPNYTAEQMRAYATAALRTKQPAASEGGVARALVWVRQWAPFTAPEDREHIAVIEEALAAYDPERMARCGNTSKQAAVEAVPIGWFTDDHLTDRSATTYDKTVADRWVAKGWPITPIYTAPPRHPADEGIDGTR